MYPFTGADIFMVSSGKSIAEPEKIKFCRPAKTFKRKTCNTIINNDLIYRKVGKETKENENFGAGIKTRR